MNLFQKHRFCSPSLAENDFRLLKNSEGNRDGEWIFLSKEGGETHSSIQRISLQTKLNSPNKLKLQPNISYKNDFTLVKIPCT